MKHLNIIIVVLAASLICGCEKTQDIQAPEEAKPIVLTRAQEQAVSDINAFSLNLFNKIWGCPWCGPGWRCGWSRSRPQ